MAVPSPTYYACFIQPSWFTSPSSSNIFLLLSRTTGASLPCERERRTDWLPGGVRYCEKFTTGRYEGLGCAMSAVSFTSDLYWLTKSTILLGFSPSYSIWRYSVPSWWLIITSSLFPQSTSLTPSISFRCEYTRSLFAIYRVVSAATTRTPRLLPWTPSFYFNLGIAASLAPYWRYPVQCPLYRNYLG